MDSNESIGQVCGSSSANSCDEPTAPPAPGVPVIGTYIVSVRDGRIHVPKRLQGYFEGSERAVLVTNTDFIGLWSERKWDEVCATTDVSVFFGDVEEAER